MLGPALTFSNTVNSLFMLPDLIGINIFAQVSYFNFCTFFKILLNQQTAGWGSTNPNMGENSQMLRRIDLIISQCQNLEEQPEEPPEDETTTTTDSTIPPEDLFSARICARALQTGGICTSDIGGPLVTMSGLVGIASSHPIPCATSPVWYFY